MEDEAGILPGGTTNAERLRSLTGEPRRLYALATAYHTAYVMGMLCAALLRPTRSRPSATWPDYAGLEEIVSNGELTIDQSDVVRVLATLPRAEHARLSGFGLDLTIAQAARRRQYGELDELLRRVGESGYPNSPLVTHAKELLVRLALGLSQRAAVP